MSKTQGTIRIPTEESIVSFREKNVKKFEPLELIVISFTMSKEFIKIVVDEDVKGLVYTVESSRTTFIATREYKEAVEVFKMYLGEVK